MPTVSKQLSILREAGVVLDETCGRSVYYSLYRKCIPEFIHCVDEIVMHRACPRTWHYIAVREPVSLARGLTLALFQPFHDRYWRSAFLVLMSWMVCPESAWNRRCLARPIFCFR